MPVYSQSRTIIIFNFIFNVISIRILTYSMQRAPASLVVNIPERGFGLVLRWSSSTVSRNVVQGYSYYPIVEEKRYETFLVRSRRVFTSSFCTGFGPVVNCLRVIILFSEAMQRLTLLDV